MDRSGPAGQEQPVGALGASTFTRFQGRVGSPFLLALLGDQNPEHTQNAAKAVTCGGRKIVTKPPIRFVSLRCPFCCPQHRDGAAPPPPGPTCPQRLHALGALGASAPCGTCGAGGLGVSTSNGIPAAPGISPPLPVMEWLSRPQD